MLLSYDELVALVSRGVICGVTLDHVNATSIDVTLGSKVLIENKNVERTISLRSQSPLSTYEYNLDKGPIVLRPGQFILAQTEQWFNLPNDISAEYKLKSSMARIGLNHCLAGWCDAGWHGSVLTLEIMNTSQHHAIKLRKGDLIGQMVFFKHRAVPDEYSYARRGRYNNDKHVQGVKNSRQIEMFSEGEEW